MGGRASSGDPAIAAHKSLHFLRIWGLIDDMRNSMVVVPVADSFFDIKRAPPLVSGAGWVLNHVQNSSKVSPWLFLRDIGLR